MMAAGVSQASACEKGRVQPVKEVTGVTRDDDATHLPGRLCLRSVGDMTEPLTRSPQRVPNGALGRATEPAEAATIPRAEAARCAIVDIE
jgi:hypothetical protein